MATEQVVITARLDDELSRPLRAAQDQFTKMGQQAERAAAQASRGLTRLQVSMDASMKKAKAFNVAYSNALDERHIRQMDLLGVALVGAFAAATYATMNYEKQLSSLRAIIGPSAGDAATLALTMNAFSQAALQAGRDTAFTATQAVQAQTELAKAGIANADILGGGLKGSLDLAAAGSVDLARAAEIAATSMNMFNLSGRDVSMIADTLASGANKSAADIDGLAQSLAMGGTVAAQMGMSIQETVGLLSLFADEGIKGSDAGTMLKTTLLRLNPTSKEAADLMERLGLSAYDAQGNFIGMEAYAGRLQGALGGLDEATRNAYITTIFGNDAWRSASLLMQYGSDGVKEYTDAMNDQGAAAEMAATMMDNLNGDLKKLRGSLETVLIGSGSNANGVLRGMVQTTTNLVNSVAGLPTPVLAAAAAATLASGAFLLLAPRVMAAKTAMDAMAISAPRAAAALGMLAKGVAVVTAAMLIADLVGNQYEQWIGQTVKSGDQASKTLEKVAASGEMTADAWRELGSAGMSMGEGLNAILDRSFMENLAAFPTYMASLGDRLPWANEAGTSIKGAVKAFESMDAGLAALVASGNPEKAAAAFKTVTDEADRQGISLDAVNELFPQYTSTLSITEASTKATAEAMDGLAGATGDAEVAITSLTAAFARAQGFLEGRDAVRGYKAALDDFDSSLKENGRTFNDNTKKGRANTEALDGIAKAAQRAYTATDANGNVTITNAKAYDRAAVSYYRNARALGMTAGAAADLTAQAFGAKAASQALGKVKANPKINGDVKDLESKLARVNGKIMQLGQGKRTPEVQVKIENAQSKATEIQRQLDVLNGKSVDPEVTASTTTAEQAIGRTSAALTDLDGKRATVYIDVVQNGSLPGGDTATSRATGPRLSTGSALARTMGKHSMVAASLGGGFKVTNMLVGGGGKGHGSGDHQAGRAIDVTGPRLGAYVEAVRRAGGFAELHGSGSGRHAHAVMGDTGSPRSPRGGVDAGQVTIGPFYFTGVSAADQKEIRATVRAAIREYGRQRLERGS